MGAFIVIAAFILLFPIGWLISKRLYMSLLITVVLGFQLFAIVSVIHRMLTGRWIGALP